MECKIGIAPEAKSSEDCIHQFLQSRKVSIVRAETSRQLPNPFDRVEIGTVGRKEIELQLEPMLGKPLVENKGMMMPGVIYDHDHLSIRASMTNEGAQKNLECLGIERLGRPGNQTPICWADRPEHRHRLVSWCMIKDRIGVFWGNPHDTPGAMLLKMAFIGKP